MELILASRSPRRQELIKRIVMDFKVVASDIDESTIKESDPVKFALAAAEIKARSVGERYPSAVVIGADTIVVYKNKIYGKPADRGDAVRMLKELSGREHQVITGVAVFRKENDKFMSAVEKTDVLFKDLNDDDINAYINDVEVMDKAGAYGIQDMGESIISSISGDYENVVGLPLKLLKRLLSGFSVPLLP